MSQVTAAPQTTVDSFRGNFMELAAFINSSWAENKEQPLQYRPEFLKSCFAYPAATSRLAPTVYENDTPIAFVAGFPRRARIEKATRRLAIVTFLTVAPEHKKKGYGVALWSELVSRLRNEGFDGMVNYCVSGSAMDQMIAGCCQRLKLPTACLYSIDYMSTLLKPTGGIPSEAPEPPSDIVSNFLQASQGIGCSASLERVWTEEEARWQCIDRHAAVTASAKGAKGYGVLTGYVSPIVNDKKTNCLFVEDVLWPELNQDERKSLLETFLNKARYAGAEMATVPRCGYADMAAFSSAGFIRTRRVMRAYLSLWNGELPANVSSFYLDVL